MTSACSSSRVEVNSHNFCLKWSNYQSHVLSVMVQLLQSETMVDVTLCAAGGEKISAHRIVLCAASSYFQEILACSEDSHPLVILSEVNAEDMHSILQFVYHGELNVDASQLSSVLQVAAALQIKGLMEVSEQLPTLVPIEDNLPQFTEGDAVFSTSSEPNGEEPVQSVCVSNINPNTNADVDEQGEGGEHCYNDVCSSAAETTNSTVSTPQNPVCSEVLANNENGQADNFLENQLIDSTTHTKVSGKCSDSSKELIQFAYEDRKKRKKRENFRRDYSEEQLAAALKDLRAGHMLVETAAAHHIPRSTLYTRAKAAGISLTVARQEHSTERVQAAVEAVTNGSSLQQASLLYQIPKTVLWRRVRAAGAREGRIFRKSQGCSLARRQAAIQALQSGQNLSKVSAEFQVPKTTLFREKIRLVESGKLPRSSLKQRDPQSSALKHSRIKEAVAACKEGKMSQAAAAITYQVPKTTIWRRLKKSGLPTSSNDKEVKRVEISNSSMREDIPSTARLQEQVSFFCEGNGQLPVAYIVTDSDFPDTALII